MSVDPSKLIHEPLVPLPDPADTLAGQMRAEGRTDAEIERAYAEVYGADARRVLGWDSGHRVTDVKFE